MMAIGKKTGGRDFEPGFSGNPAGRPKLDENLKMIRRAAASNVARALKELLSLSPSELQARREGNSITGLELMLIDLIDRGGKGDARAADLILNRYAGRIVDEAADEIDDSQDRVEIAELKKLKAMSDEELEQKLARLRKINRNIDDDIDRGVAPPLSGRPF